jgi:hypothetical protein
MAVDATFSGVPDGVHNGTDTVLWSAVATSGSWDFANTLEPHTGLRAIRAWNMSDGDTATISKGSTLDFSDYSSLSGWIYIRRLNATTQQLRVCFTAGGVLVGNTANIVDYIDSGSADVYQRFAIPKADLGIADVEVDALEFYFVVDSGLSPRVYIDDIQIEESGGRSFVAMPAPGVTYQYRRLELTLAGNVPGVVADGTMKGLAYDELLGLPVLESGITLQTFEKGLPQVAVTFKQLSDFIGFTFCIDESFSDGENTLIKLVVDLPAWVTLDAADDDRVEMLLSDDLSPLLVFNAIIIGREMVRHADDP